MRLILQLLIIIFYGKSLESKNNVAVNIIAYNRPDYFEVVLKSIESNPKYITDLMDFYFFLDGGIGSKQVELERLIKLSNLKNITIVKRETNFHLVSNILSARSHIFDDLGYEYLIELEDDMQITPQFFKLILAFNKWAKNKFNNIGGVMLFNICRNDISEKKELLKDCSVIIGHRGLMLSSDIWKIIKPFLAEYYKTYEESDRSKIKVLDWMEDKIKLYNPCISYDDKFLVNPAYEVIKNLIHTKNWSHFQDAATNLAILVNNLVVLATSVNRLLDIGREGLNFNEEGWKEKYHNMKLDAFCEDEYIEDFIYKP